MWSLRLIVLISALAALPKPLWAEGSLLETVHNLSFRLNEAESDISELRQKLNESESNISKIESKTINSDSSILDIRQRLNDSESNISEIQQILNDAESNISELRRNRGLITLSHGFSSGSDQETMFRFNLQESGFIILNGIAMNSYQISSFSPVPASIILSASINGQICAHDAHFQELRRSGFMVGGRVQNIHSSIACSTVLNEGDHVVTFVRRDGLGSEQQFTQGQYTVFRMGK